MHPESVRTISKVSDQLLRERLEVIRVLIEEQDHYEAVLRDQITNEHFYHRADRHLNITEGGAEEMYHAFLPLETDDVISILVGNERKVYPDDWKREYLRNGPDGFFVWFDPAMENDSEADEQFGKYLIEKMKEFKQQGIFDPESIQALFKDIEQLRGDTEKNSGTE